MQIYKGMDIGTAKMPVDQRLVAHWGIDLVDPGEPYSAALFQDYARSCFADIDSRGKGSVLCGGTGFYIRAAIDDYEFPSGEQVGNPIRDKYNALAQELGSQGIWELLRDNDAASAALIAPRDTKRVVRAFELLADGTSYAVQKENLAHIPQAVPAVFIGLSVDRDVLARRIDVRVDDMIDCGLLDEVETLLDGGFRTGITAPQAIGYKELVGVIDGAIELADAIEQIKLATRRYAKRQRTWFRKDTRIHWVDANALNLDYMEEEACKIVDTIAPQ